FHLDDVVFILARVQFLAALVAREMHHGWVVLSGNRAKATQVAYVLYISTTRRFPRRCQALCCRKNRVCRSVRFRAIFSGWHALSLRRACVPPRTEPRPSQTQGV